MVAVAEMDLAVARVVAALRDPDPRTDGTGFARLQDAGVAVDSGLMAAEARRSMAGFLTRLARGRPQVTLKLATSLDGRIALSTGESKWITGPQARAHVHLERARHADPLKSRAGSLKGADGAFGLGIGDGFIETRFDNQEMMSHLAPTPLGCPARR